MKSYELTYLISSEISEQEVRELQAKIASFIQDNGGVLVQEKPAFKIRLAYQIKKQAGAFLVIVDFQFLPEKINDFEKKLKMESKILRYLLLAKLPAKKIKKVRTFKALEVKKATKEKKLRHLDFPIRVSFFLP